MNSASRVSNVDISVWVLMIYYFCRNIYFSFFTVKPNGEC